MNRAKSLDLSKIVWAHQADAKHKFICAVCSEDAIPVLQVTEKVPYFRHRNAQEDCDLSVVSGSLRDSSHDGQFRAQLRLALEANSDASTAWKLRLWLPSHDSVNYTGTISIAHTYGRIDLRRLYHSANYVEFFCDAFPKLSSYEAKAPHDLAFGAMSYLSAFVDRAKTVRLNPLRTFTVFDAHTNFADGEAVNWMKKWVDGAALECGQPYYLLTSDTAVGVPPELAAENLAPNESAGGVESWGSKWNCFRIYLPEKISADLATWLLTQTGFTTTSTGASSAHPANVEMKTSLPTLVHAKGNVDVIDTQATNDADDYEQIEDRVSVQVWTIRRLTEALEGRGREIIYIPTFQRGFVWKEAQRRELIKSIKQHYPVGSLLLYEAGFIGNRTKYEIVDGLQRSRSLLSYAQNQLTDIVADDLDATFFDGILKRLNLVLPSHDFDDREQLRNRVKRATVSWLRACTDVTVSGGFSAVGLAEKLASVCDRNDPMSIMAICERLLADVAKTLDISAFEIPVIVFSGDRMKLPDIFKRLNTGGVALNKYDILGCLWDGKLVEVTNESVIALVKERQKLIDIAAAIRGERAVRISQGQIDFFDFLCAVGATLSRETPGLFAAAKQASKGEPEAHGFSVAALCFAIDTKTKDFEQLPERVAAYHSCDVFLADLRVASELVWEILAPVLSLKFENAVESFAHKELQMAAMVASMFRAISLRAVDASTISVAERQRNLRQHYLADAFRSFWSGSGDSKALRLIREDAFARPVSSKAMQYYLKTWSSENAEAQAIRAARRAKLDVHSALFLKAYAAANGMSPGDTLSMKLAVDPATLTSLRLPTGFILPNIILMNARGVAVADPGRELPALTASPSALQVNEYFEQRLENMIDTIVAYFGFARSETSRLSS